MGGISGLISLLCMVAVSSLNIGDAVPSLDGTHWVKGSPPVFKNQIVVLEIWRSSCGNCKAQIPHLTSLQEKYGDRISIVAISKDPVDTLEEFLKANNDQIGYTVGKVTKEFLDPFMAGVSGVPYAYLIKDGAVIWKGHPSSIDDILQRAVEGKVDLQQLKTVADLEEKLSTALKTSDLDSVAPIDQKLLLLDPNNEQGLDVGMSIAKYNKEPAGIKEMFDNVRLAELDANRANTFAMMLIAESDLAYRYPETALKFSLHALKKDPDNDYSMDVYARVLYALGDIDKAILWEKKALVLKPNEDFYKTNLDYYMTVKGIKEKNNYNYAPK